jgi:hypothetical protein
MLATPSIQPDTFIVNNFGENNDAACAEPYIGQVDVPADANPINDIPVQQSIRQVSYGACPEKNHSVQFARRRIFYAQKSQNPYSQDRRRQTSIMCHLKLHK